MTDTQLCDAVAEACRCGLLAGHTGPHECHEIDGCGGAWEGVIGEDFRVVRFPNLRRAFAALFGGES